VIFHSRLSFACPCYANLVCFIMQSRRYHDTFWKMAHAAVSIRIARYCFLPSPTAGLQQALVLHEADLQMNCANMVEAVFAVWNRKSCPEVALPIQALNSLFNLPPLACSFPIHVLVCASGDMPSIPPPESSGCLLSFQFCSLIHFHFSDSEHSRHQQLIPMLLLVLLVLFLPFFYIS
jgi:hypothetical protein